MKNVKPDDLEDLSHVIRNQISVTREALLTMEKEINLIVNGYQAIEKALRVYRKKVDAVVSNNGVAKTGNSSKKSNKEEGQK